MIKKFKQFITENVDTDIDYDAVLYYIRDNGYGDIPHQRFDDFENSTYYNDETSTELYSKSFLSYIDDIRDGIIDE